MTKKYYPLFDVLKFIFALFILMHHAEINILVNHNIHSSIFSTSYLAVEGFLYISGFFLASSANRWSTYSTFYWSDVVIHRIKRIYPIFLYCLAVYLLVDYLLKYFWGLDHLNSSDFFPSLFMVGSVFVKNQILGFWYMPVFLWVGFLYLYLLLYYKHISINLIVPLSCILGYAWCYHQFGALPLHVEPYIGSFMTGGLLRGIAGLALGILLFNIHTYIHTHIHTSRITRILFFVLFIYFLIKSIKLFLRESIDYNDFLIIWYLSAVVLLSANINFENSYIGKITKYLGDISYYIFLIHILILNVLIDFGLSDIKATAIEKLVISFFAVVFVSVFLKKYQNKVFSLATNLFKSINTFLKKWN